MRTRIVVLRVPSLRAAILLASIIFYRVINCGNSLQPTLTPPNWYLQWGLLIDRSTSIT
ncbi:hypothetical protein Hanom_Chr06g00497541 [Helianthus anomalus]